MLPSYRSVLPGVPVQFLPHGWVSHFERVRSCPDSVQGIDFNSSGNLTAYRRAVFARLER
jgi:hypothetical protein